MKGYNYLMFKDNGWGRTMRKLFIVIIGLISTLTIIGCSAQAAAPTPKNQKIVIMYSSIAYSQPNI
jgi:uncharacterized protein YcfL